MAFQPGESGNPKGRPAGSKNKNTALVKAFIRDFTEDGFDKFKEELSKLTGIQFVKIYIQLYQHCVDVDDNIELDANDKLIQLFNEKIKSLKQKI